MADKLNIQFRIKAVDAFSATMKKLDAKLDSLKGKMDRVNFTVDIDVDVNEDKFNRAMDNIRDRTQRVNDKIIIDTEVNGDTDLINRLRNIQDQTQRVTDTVIIDTEVDIDRDLTNLPNRLKRIGDQAQHKFGKIRVRVDTDDDGKKIFRRVQDMTDDINRIVDRSNGRNIIKIAIADFWGDFQKKISKIANFSRNIGEVMQHYLVGGIVSALPMIVPAIASIGAALGALLPIIGTVGGGIMGLGTAFGLAGAGALAYGLLAGSVLGTVFESSKKLGELQAELNNTTDAKERVKIMEKMAEVTGMLSAEQQKAMGSLNNMKAVWGEIRGAMEPQIVITFGTAMDALSRILMYTTPMFESVVKHADNLANALMFNIDSTDFQAFVDMLNTHAGPAMESIFKSLGNFTMGIFNLMTAFAPMSVSMQDGFLGMSESFRAWTASLKDSERFNAFVDYAKENLPKLADIFGSLVKGLSSMGEAFAPFAADMLTGLQNLMNRFQEFSANMKTNDGFQKFIDYTRENGPVLVSFLGELIKFLVNLGEAFAPVGSAMMKFSDEMFSIINALMDAHPWFFKGVAAVLALGAMVLTHIPTMLLMSTVTSKLGPVIGTIIAWIGKILPRFGAIGSMLVNVIPKVLQFGLTIGRLGTPIGLIITAVILLATTIYKKWDSIVAGTKSMVAKLSTFFTNLGKTYRKVIDDIVRAFDKITGINLYESGKKIVRGLIDGITSMIGAAGKAIGKVAEKVRGFLPFSPAKEGPLRDINKLNFAGPITDSIYGDAAAIQSAMGSILKVPDINAGGFTEGTYAARSNGFNTQGAQTNEGVAELLKVLTDDKNMGDVVLMVDSYELARVTRKANDQLQGSRMGLMTAVAGA